jgi:hypothetical protein
MESNATINILKLSLVDQICRPSTGRRSTSSGVTLSPARWDATVTSAGTWGGGPKPFVPGGRIRSPGDPRVAGRSCIIGCRNVAYRLRLYAWGSPRHVESPADTRGTRNACHFRHSDARALQSAAH